MGHSDFDPEIEQLATAHERASSAMLKIVLAYLAGQLTFEAASTQLGQVAQALAQASAAWVQSVVPRLYADGMKTAQDALRGASEPSGASPNTNLHTEALRLHQEDLAADLAATTNRMTDDAKTNLRNVARSQISEMLASGRNAIPQSREMRDELEERGIKFTDKRGRRWDAGAYSRMVLRTKAVDVSNDANLNVARELGSAYVRVFDGGPGDVDEPCKVANGQIWSAEYAARNKLEHPQCRRAFAPLPSTFDGKPDRE